MHAVHLDNVNAILLLIPVLQGKMNSNALLKNSSLFVAYMGCLGWGSAYFYGWVSLFIMVSHGGLSVQVLTMLQEACFMQLL